LNPLFAPSFFAMAERGRPMLLIFSEADRLYWEWDEKFVPRHRERLSRVESAYRVHMVAKANHVLSQREGEQDMLAVTCGWLEQEFSRGGEVGGGVASSSAVAGA
jgi:hypothetical protein